MKKFLITFVASMLVLATCLLGCGCMAASPLEFNQNFAGNGSSFTPLGASYKETLTYNLSYETEFSSLKKNERIPQSIIPLYSGQFVTHFQASVTLPDGIQSNLDFQSEIHYLHSEFDLTVTLKDGTVYQDKLITDSYFYSVGFSYAPIYAIQTNKQVLLACDDQYQNIRATVAINQYETLYNKTSYTLIRKEHESTDQAVLKNVDASVLHEQKTNLKLIDTTTYDYTPKTLIDNTQLIFGMRNIDATSSSSKYLPTVAPIYGREKTLAVKNFDTNTKDMTINGKTYQIPLKYYSFSIADNYNSGIPQIIAYQTKAVDDLSYASLPVIIAQPLVEYGTSYLTYGVLKYTLAQVSIVK